MNVIVCVKQVPDTTNVRIDPETNTLVREGVESIINPFDMYAIEEGLRLKEKNGGRVTVISMGPPQAKEALKEAISLGADEVILLSDRGFAGSDTLATSYCLSMGISKVEDFDLIICGRQAIDGDTAQVGPEVAENLGLPYVAYVRKIEEITSDTMKVERMMEDGYEVIETSLPALITVVKEINEPRLPSLRGKMKAKKTEPTVWGMEDLNPDPEMVGMKGSPTKVEKIFTPERRTNLEMIEGELNEVVEALYQRLKATKLV